MLAWIYFNLKQFIQPNKFINKFIFINNKFKNYINLKMWPTRFKSNIIASFLSQNFVLNNLQTFFLRKNLVFNKNRYARTRQTCRVIVYWTLWLNIFTIYGLFFYFYQFTFNFGFLWWGLFLLFSSFIFSRYIKYFNFNLFTLWKEFHLFLVWLFTILNDILFYKFKKNLKKIFINFEHINFYFIYKFLHNIYLHIKYLPYYLYSTKWYQENFFDHIQEKFYSVTEELYQTPYGPSYFRWHWATYMPLAYPYIFYNLNFAKIRNLLIELHSNQFWLISKTENKKVIILEIDTEDDIFDNLHNHYDEVFLFIEDWIYDYESAISEEEEAAKSFSEKFESYCFNLFL